MITCMEMKSLILKYASKIMFYDVNIRCYQGLSPTQFFIAGHVAEVEALDRTAE